MSRDPYPTDGADPPDTLADEAACMRRALELAARGEGAVEPNPMVGCVVARRTDAGAYRVVGEGWHARFGGPHAEAAALAQAGDKARGATLFVTLEPCAHTGKTPPCVEAILHAGVERVFAAVRDPDPRVDGGGFERLRREGVACEVGQGGAEALRLLAPYLKLQQRGLPWVIAKWAMTLDGKIAAAGGDSQWISGDESRKQVHRLRGVVDAVVVGPGTLAADDPLLTARPPGPRVPLRIVVGLTRPGPPTRRLFDSLADGPVLAAVGADYPASDAEALRSRGVEVLVTEGQDLGGIAACTLEELGRRRLTNVLVEGGGGLLGALFDRDAIDEARVFLAPKVIGGAGAPGPVAGTGLERIADARVFEPLSCEQFGDDLCVTTRRRPPL
ncbi:Riboflavin biosynthesis protein RibD [Pseudobythopirellula maris]|uniref:Riboflavin biosynthesis protein RibD n=1 Tax=Pseudobythopirellula maris TaxID=2527991 RepID=A0A5C5ZNH2_9BACT|nr:bifunctional diaminohydroxyphosphoribosylaminopyrimidine deaminase/5-amino-6-(5-phosphoribosylamino)uracil reductase RibD [Pseudobythopirellula maris]TWT88666.1 Riboflavin biosynthesis protein RibD [Pseudobythopirellula maris]